MTLLGDAQWKWLEEQLQVPANLRIIASSIQTLAFEKGMENWGNVPHEQQRLFELLKKHKFGLFGAITSKPKNKAAQEIRPELRDKGHVYFSPIVGMRQIFNLDVCIRPCRSFPGNPLNFIRRTADGGFEEPAVDAVIFRQNTEGLYAGVEYHPLPQDVRDKLTETHPAQMGRMAHVDSADIAMSCRIFTRGACQAIVRDAFEYAKKFGYKTVTVVEKPNVVRETSGLMVREARKIAKDYPGIELWETNIDAMCMWLVKNPEDYGVIVAGNMFGDIVSDAFAGLVGGLGFACSGNIGDEVAVFEPTQSIEVRGGAGDVRTAQWPAAQRRAGAVAAPCRARRRRTRAPGWGPLCSRGRP